MASPLALPILGGSLLVAVALGVHLGESSVGLINPIYFQEAPLHPRERGAAIDERSLNRAQPAYADLYGWEQGHAAIAADCGDCDALRARDAYAYSARVPYFGNRAEVRAAVAEARDELGERFAEVPEEVVPRVSPIERYAYYPVSDDDYAVSDDDRGYRSSGRAPATRSEFKEPPGEADKDEFQD